MTRAKIKVLQAALFAALSTVSFAAATEPASAPVGWCVDDLCLDQPGSALRRFESRTLDAGSPGGCGPLLRRYAVARTDGTLTVTLALESKAQASLGRIVGLERAYSDPVTRVQFEQMVRDTSRKLDARVGLREVREREGRVRMQGRKTDATLELTWSSQGSPALKARLAKELSEQPCQPHPAQALATPTALTQH